MARGLVLGHVRGHSCSVRKRSQELCVAAAECGSAAPCRLFCAQPSFREGGVAERRFSSEEVSRMSLVQWAEAFKQQTVDVAAMDVDTISYLESAERLRGIVRSGLLRHTDLIEHPDRFFLAHRLLAEHAPRLGPGFWIRFTVHYNLCMGTVLGLGNDEQVKELDNIQERGAYKLILGVA